MTNKKRLLVFLSYASEDRPAVKKLYEQLVIDGIDAWLDEEKLLPGQDWQLEISKAVKSSDAIIVFISSRSIKKAGYVQKEIKLAMDVAQEKPEGTIYIIPARLDECIVPNFLNRYQWVDLFEDKGYEKIRRTLQTQFDLPEMKNLDFSYSAEHLELETNHTSQIIKKSNTTISQTTTSIQNDHSKKLKEIYNKRLQILELQSAKFGLSVPPHILMEIEEIKEIISRIDSQP